MKLVILGLLLSLSLNAFAFPPIKIEPPPDTQQGCGAE